MATPIIAVRQLGKRYKLGDTLRHDTLRDHIAYAARALWRGGGRAPKGEAAQRDVPPAGEIWALKDVSFDVRPGEVIGIVGRNGAGKSTLLKILSQITEPTEGEVRVKGRIASLLEVGTGFHLELSGRENIFLNGAILGMSQQEIRKKFDEIVAFAEVEQFLDTPVKRYSSGMYVRLAFAVAAHLEPEILVVDEVLAVGDTAFQQKCLGKMDNVARAGRTILFVSHNMAAVQGLCTKGLLLEKGRLVASGLINDVVNRYMRGIASASSESGFSPDCRSGNGQVLIKNMELECDGVPNTAVTGGKIRLTISYEAKNGNLPIQFLIGVYDSFNSRVLALDSQVVDDLPQTFPAKGKVQLEFPGEFCLAPGRYSLNVAACLHKEFVDHIHGALAFTIEEGDFFGTGRLPYGKATVLCRNRWKLIT